MKLKIEKADLLDGINIVSKAVANGGTMPILSCILLNATSGGLQLTGNDLEMGIQTKTIDAGVELPGDIAMDARLLSDIVKKLPDEEVSIMVDEKLVAEIKCGNSVFKIVGSDAEGFPCIPEVERANKFAIKESILRNMIKQTIFSVSGDYSKPAMTGGLFKVEDGTVNLVTVDGFRISHRYHTVDAVEDPFNVIIPEKTMGDIAKLLDGSGDNEAVMYFTDNHVLFELNACTVVSRVINGKFIEYASVFNAEHSTQIKVNRTNLLLSLDRACLIAQENLKRTPVIFDIDNNIVTVTSKAERGAVREELSAETEGNKLSIGFNPRFLIEALKAIEDTEVTIQFGKEISPFIIRPVNEGNYRYLILPLRMDK